MYILGYVSYLTNKLGWESNRRAPRRGRGAGGILTAPRRWRERWAAIRELDSLPDATLRDIGLDRAGIPAAVDALMRAEKQDKAAESYRTGTPAGSFKVAGCG